MWVHKTHPLVTTEHSCSPFGLGLTRAHLSMFGLFQALTIASEWVGGTVQAATGPSVASTCILPEMAVIKIATDLTENKSLP